MTFDKTATPPAGYVDILPAEVLMPDGYTIIRRARVVLSDGRMVVFAENPSEPSDIYVAHDTPVLAVHEWPDPYAPVTDQRAVVATTAGLVYVNRMRGCGCGGSGLSLVDAAAVYPPKVAKPRRKTSA